MEQLPVDILEHTTDFLSPLDSINLRRTSRKLQNQVSSCTTAKKSRHPGTIVSHHYHHDMNHSLFCHGCNVDTKECSMEPKTTCYKDSEEALSDMNILKILSNRGVSNSPTGAATTSPSRIDFAEASDLFTSRPMVATHFDQTSVGNLPYSHMDGVEDSMVVSSTAQKESPLSPRIDFTDASELFTDNPMAVSYFQSYLDMGGMSFDGEEHSVPPIIYVFEED